MSIIRLGDHRIFSKGTEAQFLKGKQILEKGKISHRIYLLKRGAVSIEDSSGRKIHFSKPLSLFGWESCFFDEPNNYTITTEGSCHFVVLTKKELDDILLNRSDEIKRLSFYSFQTTLDLYQKFNDVSFEPVAVEREENKDFHPLQDLIQLFINNFITHKQTADLLEHQIHTALTILGTYTDTQRIIYYEYNAEAHEFKATYGWSETEKGDIWNNHKFLTDSIPFIAKRLTGLNDVRINDITKDLLAYPEDLKTIENLGAKSCLFLPLGEHQNLCSVLCFMTTDQKQNWDNKAVSILKMLHAILHHEIIRIKKDLKFQELSRENTLTGLPNRTAFLSELKTILNTTKRSKKLTAVLYVKFDQLMQNFSNDSLLKGTLMALIKEKLNAICRKGDIIGHFNEDVFVIALSNMKHKNDIRVIANRLVDLLETPFNIIDKLHHIASSIGISFYPENGKTPQELIEQAEEAMYHAEDKPGTAYHFSSITKHATSANLSKIETEIKDACKKNNILTYFQPIYDLNTKKIVAAEALSRWRKEDDSIAMPNEFLSICEKTGLIVHLSEKILKDTCVNMNIWKEKGYLIPVSINVSMRWLIDDDFITIIKDTLDTHRIDPSQLTIELTEGILLRDIDHAQEILNKLKEIGVKLCLDDFGTGYTSLAFLHQLPIDSIKIDKGFVHNISKDKNTPKLIKGLLKLADELKLEVIAEGIETKPQEKFLQEIGCIYGQGYLYSRAIPELDFLSQLALNKA